MVNANEMPELVVKYIFKREFSNCRGLNGILLIKGSTFQHLY